MKWAIVPATTAPQSVYKTFSTKVYPRLGVLLMGLR